MLWPFANTEHMHQLLMRALSNEHTHQELMPTLSNEHTNQELMRALSIRIRYLHMYALSKDPFKTCWAYAQGTDACTEHTHKELMHMLRLKIQAIENLTLGHL